MYENKLVRRRLLILRLIVRCALWSEKYGNHSSAAGMLDAGQQNDRVGRSTASYCCTYPYSSLGWRHSINGNTTHIANLFKISLPEHLFTYAHK